MAIDLTPLLYVVLGMKGLFVVMAALAAYAVFHCLDKCLALGEKRFAHSNVWNYYVAGSHSHLMCSVRIIENLRRSCP